jgi:membrane fusion protein (multidrug efflux system)
VNSYPSVNFEGRLIEVNPAMDEQTRSAKVRIQVVNTGGKLKAGMFGQGEILIGVKSALVIPSSAVYRDDRSAKTSYVYVRENGRAARRNVRIGQERDSQLEIVDGLKPGDQVVAEQSIEIAQGVRVEPRR